MLPAEVRKHLFTVEEYHRMGEAGVFSEDDRVELVEGEIVQMTPIGWRHAQAVTALTTSLAAQVANRYDISVQNPLVVDDYGEYQPDLAVLEKDREGGRPPLASEAALVVEVADSSLSYDKDVKFPLYAGASITEAWLVDLRSDRIEVHSEPRAPAGGYSRAEVYGRGETVRSATLEGLKISVEEMLGVNT